MAHQTLRAPIRRRGRDLSWSAIKRSLTSSPFPPAALSSTSFSLCFPPQIAKTSRFHRISPALTSGFLSCFTITSRCPVSPLCSWPPRCRQEPRRSARARRRGQTPRRALATVPTCTIPAWCALRRVSGIGSPPTATLPSRPHRQLGGRGHMRALCCLMARLSTWRRTRRSGYFFDTYRPSVQLFSSALHREVAWQPRTVFIS